MMYCKMRYMLINGFEISGDEDKVYGLKKALNGVKQAPWALYEKIDTYMHMYGFKRNPSDATVYIKTKGESESIIVSIYLDDIGSHILWKHLCNCNEKESCVPWKVKAYWQEVPLHMGCIAIRHHKFGLQQI